MEITLKNEEAQFNALKKQATDIADQCKLLAVTDEISLAIATQNLSKANAVVKQIEAVHKITKAPHWDNCKKIDALKNALCEPIEQAVNLGKKNILAYNAEKQRLANLEIKRINDIKNGITDYSNDAIAEMDACTTIEQLREVRNRLIVNHPTEKWAEFLPNFMAAREILNEYAKSRKTAILTPLQADEEETINIADSIQESNNQIGSEAIAETVVTKLAGSRLTWAWEVDNIANIPLEWLQPDEAIIKAYMKDNKTSLADGQVINGIKFFQQESLTIR